MAKEKTFRPKPRVPKGLEDRFADQVRAEAAMIDAIREVYELYGFEPLETGAFEYADAIGKFLPDEDRPNEGVFAFQDDDEQWLALRYDLTAPLARLVAERYDALPKPFRRYQTGRVWRNEKPGPGRFREFTQFDADSVGAPSMAADAEMVMLLADTLERVGVPRGDYVLKVNNRKVLNGVLESIGVLTADDPQAEQTKLRVLRAIDKFDRLGLEGVRLLLGAGRKDESGDFTEGAGLSEEQAGAILAFVEGKKSDFASTAEGLRALTGQSAVGAEGLQEMETIGALLDAAGFGPERVEFDPSVVRGLGYYTGPVFEAELTFETEDEKGRPVRFGSVASGGRYDDLVKRFKGVEVPATGCSIGVSRLGAALRLLGREAARVPAPAVVLVLDKERVADSQAMVAELRNAGIRAELYLGGAGMRAQLKYADKRGASLAIIEGEDERANGQVTIKDLLLGAQLAGEIEDNKAWREEQRQQETVPRADLVAAVRKILDRQSGGA